MSKRLWDILIPTIRKLGSEIWVLINPEPDSDETYSRSSGKLTTPTIPGFRMRSKKSASTVGLEATLCGMIVLEATGGSQPDKEKSRKCKTVEFATIGSKGYC